MSTEAEFAARRLELAAEEAAGAAAEAKRIADRTAAEESYISALPGLLPTLSLTDRWRELTALPSRKFCWDAELHASCIIRLSICAAIPGCRVAGLLHRSDQPDRCFGGMQRLSGALYFEFEDSLIALARLHNHWYPVSFRKTEEGWDRSLGGFRKTPGFIKVEEAVSYGRKYELTRRGNMPQNWRETL